MFHKLKDFNFENKKVLLRVDFNVPIENSVIKNDSRIRKALPTINKILENNPHQLIIISHLGRPNGEYIPELSLKPVAERLSQLLGKSVYFETNPRINNIDHVSDANIVMLENLRFDRVEKENNDNFAKKLASFGEVFVLDAFGTCHREHASIVGVPKFLPSCAGLLLEKEIKFLKDNLNKPKKPFVAIIGGAKFDKIKVINSLINKVNTIIITGIMANTFLKALGKDIGDSKYDPDSIDYAKELVDKYEKKIALPVDFILGKEFTNDTESSVAGIEDDISGKIIMDIGPYTISGYKEILTKARTIVWGGPIGVFEFDKFRRGTWDIANHLATLKAVKIIAGGDSATAIETFKLEDKMTHVSTGGGASLELLAGTKLPGIEALEQNRKSFKKN